MLDDKAKFLKFYEATTPKVQLELPSFSELCVGNYTCAHL